MTYDNTGSGSAQPINYAPVATATAAGTASFIFEYVPLTNLRAGTLSCGTAPASAVFTAVSNGNIFGSWRGTNTFGPVQLAGGDLLTVNATGLIPGVQYQLIFAGYNIIQNPNSEIVFPANYADTVSMTVEQILLTSMTNYALVAGSQTVTIHIPLSKLWRSVWLIATVTGASTIASAVLIGDQSGINFTPFASGITSSAYNTSQIALRYLIYSGPDSSATLTITVNGVAGGLTMSYWVGADLGILSNVSELSINGNFVNYLNPIPVQTTPGNPLDVVPYGGLQSSTSITGSTTQAYLVNPPAAGQSLRLHSLTVQPGTYPTTPAYYQFKSGLGGTTLLLCVLPGQTTYLMNGLLLSGATGLSVIAPSASTVNWFAQYDIVTTPTIS